MRQRHTPGTRTALAIIGRAAAVLALLLPSLAHAEGPGDPCASLPADGSADVVKRYTRTALRHALGCETGGEQLAVPASEIYRLDVPGVEPTALTLLVLARECLERSQSWLDQGFCAYDVERLDVHAADAEIDALPLGTAARARLHKLVADGATAIGALTASWARKPDAAAIAAAARDAVAAWDKLYANERERFDAAIKVERDLIAGVPPATACASSAPALAAYLREAQVGSFEEARAALTSPLGWYLVNAVVLCEIAEHRPAFATVAPFREPPGGPRRAAAYAAFAKRNQLQGATALPVSLVVAANYRVPPSIGARVIPVYEPLTARVKTARPDGEVVTVTFARATEAVKVPYNCRDTDRISRVTRSGNVYYGVECQYRNETLDATPKPVRVPRAYAAGIVAGTTLTYAAGSGDTAFPVAVLGGKKAGQLVAAYGFATEK